MLLGNKRKHTTLRKNKLKQLEKEVEKLKALLIDSGEDNIRESYFIRKALEISELLYWFISTQDNIVTVSEKLHDIFNLQVSNKLNYEEFIGFIHHDDKAMFEKTIKALDHDNPPAEFECRILSVANEIKETGNYLCKVAKVNEPLSSQTYIIGTFINNDTAEKARRDLAKAIERADESDRLKNTILANISREIRTPMNAIIGFSELLNIEKPDVEKRKDYARTIRNQGIMLLKFIDDIAELTKFESGKLIMTRTQCNLNSLLKEMEIIAHQQKRALKKESLDIKLVLPDKTGLIVYTDPGRVQQVISNLVHNAIKFTEKGFVEFGYKPLSDEKIEFFVKDTGIGISKDKQKNIFNRFAEEEIVTLKYEGSGLGLTLSKNLVRLLGGKIWVESEPGKGTAFRFTIPFEQDSTAAHNLSSVEEEQLPNYKWKDKVILVVEDDEVSFKFLEAMLQDCDAQILHATNGFQAVELCKSISKIDLILMDIKMPEMNGFEATQQIRQFNKKIPIIAQTAYVLNVDQDKCIAVGCNDCITKPIDIKEFLDKVNKFLKE
ncbi:MAG: response regulator [Bacteroidales bacterium]|nr:response regulator [Bacteroidales bacterium]